MCRYVIRERQAGRPVGTRELGSSLPDRGPPNLDTVYRHLRPSARITEFPGYNVAIDSQPCYPPQHFVTSTRHKLLWRVDTKRFD